MTLGYYPGEFNPYDDEPVEPQTVYTSEDGKHVILLDTASIFVGECNLNALVGDFVGFDAPLAYVMRLNLPMLYRQDRQQRLEFDAPRAYRQRRANIADYKHSPDIISEDGWIDEHEEIVDIEEGATVGDLFEVK